MTHRKKFLKAYFHHFDQYFLSFSEGRRALIYKEYAQIKKGFYIATKYMKVDDFFSVMRKILDLDAKLQTLMILSSIEHLDQEDILKIFQKEHSFYYSDLLGCKTNEQTPHTLLHFQLES